MLGAEGSEILTRTGAGTLTGNPLRRYWTSSLLSAAKGLAEEKEPRVLAGDFAAIRGAEKILEPGADWRALGADDDPVVREAFGRE